VTGNTVGGVEGADVGLFEHWQGQNRLAPALTPAHVVVALYGSYFEVFRLTAVLNPVATEVRKQ
jgi:hypothetical protein